MEPPAAGARVHTTVRALRSWEHTADGRMRLDTVARWAQDVAEDASSSHDDNDGSAPVWVVKSTWIRMDTRPVFEHELRVATWCDGYGRAWARRRVDLGSDRSVARCCTMWISVDRVSGSPRPLAPHAMEVLERVCRRRTPVPRLRIGEPPREASSRTWRVRATDFDLLGHVNNAAYLDAVEEVLAEECHFAPYASAIDVYAQYERPVSRRVDLGLHWWSGGSIVRVWLCDERGVVFYAACSASQPPE